MSSKGRDKVAIEGDQYYTPPWIVRQCVKIVLPTIIRRSAILNKVMPVDGVTYRTILEPSAGGGAFLEQLRPAFPGSIIHGIDINRTVGPWPDANLSLVLYGKRGTEMTGKSCILMVNTLSKLLIT